MAGRGPSLFASRETAGVSWRNAALIAVAALGAGILVAWLTTLVPGLFAADPQVTPSITPTPEVTNTAAIDVPTLQPIMRDLDEADLAAGVTTVGYTYQGNGEFSVVPGKGEPDSSGAPVRWVSIEVEDGIEANPAQFAQFVLTVLTDNRGWGSDGRLQFVQTDGVADYHIILASPFTAAAICPEDHVSYLSGPVTEVTESPGSEPAPTADPGLAAGDQQDPDAANPACAVDGNIVISTYDWTAGYEPFGQDRTAARQYIVNHHMGHLFGHDDMACESGRADVMADQSVEMPDGCTPNPWPFPDAMIGDDTTPTAAP